MKTVFGALGVLLLLVPIAIITALIIAAGVGIGAWEFIAARREVRRQRVADIVAFRYREIPLRRRRQLRQRVRDLQPRPWTGDVA